MSTTIANVESIEMEQFAPVPTSEVGTDNIDADGINNADAADEGKNNNNNSKKNIDSTDITAEETDLGDHSGEFGAARTPWWGTSLILMSDVMGTGVLGLPYVAITLGWVATMIALPVFAFFAAYAGYQLKAVKHAYPDVMSYSDAGSELVSPCFGTFTKICMLLNWGALAVYFLIATANGIADIYDEGMLSCTLNRSWIAALLLIIPAQSRDFHTISKYLSLPSTLAIIITILIVIISMLMGNTVDEGGGGDTTTSSFGDNTIVGVQPGTDAFDFLQSLSSIVFAFQGQSIFLELMTEMKQPDDFGKSLSSAYLVMLFWYALTVIVAYGMEGEYVEGFLPDSLPKGGAKTTVGVLVVFHIVVAYVIAIQPFHFWLHSTIFPSTYNKPGRKGQIHWLLLTTGYILFAFIIGNLIPFFADLQALIGALLGSPIVFGWPSMYYLLTNRNTQGSWSDAFKHMGVINSSLTLLMLCVVTPIFLVLGTWGGIVAIIDDIADAGKPFSCE